MTIILVRHGRSAHMQRGLLDLAAVHRWREAYEAAGIDETEEPPAALAALAASSGAIVASAAPRAIASAKLLAPERGIVTSTLLHELELVPPNIRRIRMPMLAWAVAYGLQRLLQIAMRRSHVSAAERQRARDAAAWLTELAEQHGTVLAVTHAAFRALLSEQLTGSGWRCERPRGRAHHWSAWSFRR